MAETINDLRDFTDLPIAVMALTEHINFVVKVQTPHKGEVVLDTKQTNYPFIFGSVTQTEKGSKLIYELHTLEREAREFLFNQWRVNFD